MVGKLRISAFLWYFWKKYFVKRQNFDDALGQTFYMTWDCVVVHLVILEKSKHQKGRSRERGRESPLVHQRRQRECHLITPFCALGKRRRKATEFLVYIKIQTWKDSRNCLCYFYFNCQASAFQTLILLLAQCYATTMTMPLFCSVLMIAGWAVRQCAPLLYKILYLYLYLCIIKLYICDNDNT